MEVPMNENYKDNNQNFNDINENKKGKWVNQLVYILLAILVGGFGLHKFYEGKAGLGILYLLFCWTGIPSIIALIEGISAATKKANNDGNIFLE